MNYSNRQMLCILISISLYVTGVSAETLNVGPDKEFTGIQNAINFAGNGDVIIVSPGIYEEHIDFLGKNITVTSTNPDDPGIVENTVIDAGGSGSAVTFAHGETSDAILTGFTITGGYGTELENNSNTVVGGGIVCISASPTIRHNIITDNHGPLDENTVVNVGAGIACLGSNAIITCNIIKDNTTYGAAAIFVSTSNPIISNNLIYNNTATYIGGVYLAYGGYFINNTMVNNSATAMGGHIGALGDESAGRFVIENNIICNAGEGGGIYVQGGPADYDAVRYNNVWNNTGGNYDNLPDQTGLNGNISQNPFFFDISENDFRLLPESPCIDAGLNEPTGGLLTQDYAGQVRPVDGDYDGEPVTDMGAFEAEGSTDPVIFISRSNLFFVAVEGGDSTASKMLTIRNGGQGLLNWTIEESCDWLEISPSSGSSSGGDDQTEVRVSINTTGMLAGSYAFVLDIVSPEALNSPKRVTVDLFISGEGEILVPAMAGTIQQAIDMALEGDTIIVSPGVYNENIQLSGKNITLTSIDTADTNIVNSTVIQGLGNGPVVTFDGTEGETCILTGFTITGGYNTASGGGIRGNGSFATIGHCVFRDNVADGAPGGGIWGIAGTISHCLFENNHANAGGGLAKCSGVISNCLFVNNIANLYGAALRNCDGLVVNCTLVNDIQPAQSMVHASDGVFENCIIQSASGPIFSSSTAVTRYCCYPWAAGEGDIDDAPMFFAPNNGDYHLSPDSPCINAGDPDFVVSPGILDIDRQDRIQFWRIDIGADEFDGYVKPIACAGDDQHVQRVQLIELDGSESWSYDPSGITVYNWTQTSGPAVDLSDVTAMQPTFMPTSEGEYIFELVVSVDGVNWSQPDEVLIIVGNHRPVADAGLPRYAAQDPVTLYGGNSYDPDFSTEILSYQWRQVSGPTVFTKGANTASLTVSGFVQTSVVQECEFELVVCDGDLTSHPDVVKVIIVPDTGDGLLLMDGQFDPDKPTMFYFDGGNGIDGHTSLWDGVWPEQANFISPTGSGVYDGYAPPYERWGDKLIVFLSSVAPDYKQPIQTLGFSTGGQPAMDVANYLNLTYSDRRYAVNRVSFTDVCCRDYTYDAELFKNNPVDGEPAWIDNYRAGMAVVSNGLNVDFPGGDHGTPIGWYKSSINDSSWPGGDMYADGLTGGYYFSVIGPGRNLQLARGGSSYYFNWINSFPDYLVHHDESVYPGKFPEPVTLIGPAGGTQAGDAAVLTCQTSRNVTRYRLLVGIDPYRVMDYTVISDTSEPPTEAVTQAQLSEDARYWTIQVRDQYGSTIHADPIHLPWPITISVPKDIRSIQEAINLAADGDTIIVSPGVYRENIELKGKHVFLKSSDPTNATVIARTVIQGVGNGPVVTFDGTEGETCILTGFTITGGYNTASGGGIRGNGSFATIRHCVFRDNTAVGAPGGGIWGVAGTISHCVFENNHGNSGGGLAKCSGVISNCLFVNNIANLYGAALHNCDGLVVHCTLVNDVQPVQSMVNMSDGVLENCIIQSDSGPIFSSSTAVTRYCCYPGAAGEGDIDDDPLFFSPVNGNYHLLPDSPCIDAGDPAYIPEEGETDLDGWVRKIGSSIDIGAMEFDGQHACIDYWPREFHFYVSDDTFLYDENSISIKNCGASSLKWQIEEECSWLSISPADGETTDAIDQAVIFIDANELPEGTYKYTANISATDTINTNQPVEIFLHVNHTVLHVPSEYRRIQNAINFAGDGDTIIVSPGIYEENINFFGKNVTLTSIDPADTNIVNSTIIQGLGNGSVVTFGGAEAETCILTGLTITGGYSTANGGGIRGNDSLATIRHCVFRDNIADGAPGGGIWGIAGAISHCLFENNRAKSGGGLAKCSGVISNCLIINNITDLYGAAFHNCDGLVVNCTLVNDIQPELSMVHISDGVLKNCIIQSASGSIFSSSTAVTRYCCYPGGTGEGDIDADPLFHDPANNNYHLLPDSPCIDAGDPTSDFSLEPAPNGGRINMGVYGNTVEATLSRDGLIPLGFEIVNKTRVGRTVFEYELAVLLQNSNGYAMEDVQLRLVDVDEAVISVLDDQIVMPLIGVGEILISQDTFSLTIDRSEQIATGRLTWELTYYVDGQAQPASFITMSLSEIDSVPGDITGEGDVNFLDFAVLSQQWQQAPGIPSADIAPSSELDNFVGIEDLLYLAENWLWNASE